MEQELFCVANATSRPCPRPSAVRNIPTTTKISLHKVLHYDVKSANVIRLYNQAFYTIIDSVIYVSAATISVGRLLIYSFKMTFVASIFV